MPLRVGPFYDGTEKDMLIIDTSQCRTRKPSVELLESVHLRPTYVRWQRGSMHHILTDKRVILFFSVFLHHAAAVEHQLYHLSDFRSTDTVALTMGVTFRKTKIQHLLPNLIWKKVLSVAKLR